MIAKLIVHADSRVAALEKMQTALNETRLHGIATNLDYLRQIVATEAFHTGNVWTRLLDSFTPKAPVIELIQPGTWSSIQDYPGHLVYWDIGVPPSGPMDHYAFRLAIRIVGNAEEAAGLKFTLQGPNLRFYSDALIALTGADCPAALDGEEVAYWQLLTQDKAAVVFGCWTSVSRKSVLPVFEKLNGLMLYPVQYEGEDMSPNVFYTGAAPNQQAILAVEYLMSEDGGSAKRFFLHSKGVKDSDIEEVYTPFGYSDDQTIVANIKKFLAGGKTAVVSTSNGDSNVPFYKELANHRGIKVPMSPSSPSRSAKRSCAASTPNRWSATSPRGTTSSQWITQPINSLSPTTALTPKRTSCRTPIPW